MATYDEGADVVPSLGGRFENHPRGYVGRLFRVNNPNTIRVGHCFMRGRIKHGDLVLCVAHTGDWFQDYIFVAEYENGWKGLPNYRFGSYGIGDAERLDLILKDSQIELLKEGELVPKEAVTT